MSHQAKKSQKMPIKMLMGIRKKRKHIQTRREQCVRGFWSASLRQCARAAATMRNGYNCVFASLNSEQRAGCGDREEKEKGSKKEARQGLDKFTTF